MAGSNYRPDCPDTIPECNGAFDADSGDGGHGR